MSQQTVRKIALTSTGPLSGKSTLAKYLEREYGFIRADHSRTLVSSYVDHMRKNYAVSYAWLTLEDVYRDKEAYRRDLQDYGHEIGFNDTEKTERWVRQTLSQSGCSITQARCPGSKPAICPDKSVVFDSFRGEKQAHVLREMGFVLVQLHIPEDIRHHRADALGMPYEDVVRSMEAHPELERGIKKPDVHLLATMPVPNIARFLLGDSEIRRMLREREEV